MCCWVFYPAMPSPVVLRAETQYAGEALFVTRGKISQLRDFNDYFVGCKARKGGGVIVAEGMGRDNVSSLG